MKVLLKILYRSGLMVGIYGIFMILLHKNIFMAKKYEYFFTKDNTEYRPLILLWIPTFHKRDWELPNTKLCGGGCDITANRSFQGESDALVFYMKATDPLDIPDRSKRSPNHIYVWWCHENPHTVKYYWRKTLNSFENFFNLTMHYRTDSKVIASLMPYTARDWFLHRIGRSEESDVKTLKRHTTDEEFDAMFYQLMKKKRKNAAWIASDCDVVPGAVERMNLVKKIGKEGKFEIDKFGKCGNRELLKKPKKFYTFLQKYKFYLAFENTRFCRNYITEKFWYNSLYAGTVPVVWGAHKSDVEKVAPPNSFIHVDDFNGDPKQLTDYLRMLDKNVTAYKEYFRWWTMPGFYPIHNFRESEIEGQFSVSESLFDYEVNGFCHLCDLLHKRRHKNISNIVSNLGKEFYGKDNSNCGLL